MFRDALKRACVVDFGHEVVAETESGIAAVKLCRSHRPDVVLLDWSLDDLGGFEVARQIAAALPSTKILVVSCHQDEYTMYRIEQAKVHGFIDKNTHALKIIGEALDELRSGRTYFASTFQLARSARTTDSNSFFKVLSEAQQVVLSLIGQGLSDDEIGRRLNISPNTAKTHRRNISQKLGVFGTPKLIAFAIAHGLTGVRKFSA